MSEIDWRKAPEGATHWGPDTEEFIEAWYKKSGDEWFCATKYTSWKWMVDKDMEPYRIQEMLERPSEWSGEGLPPVGTVCEYAWHGKWSQVEIIAHWKAPADWVAIYVPLEEGQYSTKCGRAIAGSFRPLRTPEQIAAEEREKEIANIAKCILNIKKEHQANAYLIAEVLHGIGYRKFEGGAE